MATEPRLGGGTYVPVSRQEAILRSDGLEIALLVADEDLSVTYATRGAGERVTGPHVHRHAEAFYVLEGELAFEVGAERETVAVGAGGLVAVPPGVAHSYRTAGGRPARWLVIHARDGGFAAFMRGLRDGVEVEWDVAPVPAGGGLPADRAVVSRTTSDPLFATPEPRRVGEGLVCDTLAARCRCSSRRAPSDPATCRTRPV